MHMNRPCIGLQKQRVEPVDRRAVFTPLQPLQSKPQHCPPAAQRGACIPQRVQHVTVAHRSKTAVGCGDQVAAGIRQRPVKVENDRLHAFPFGPGLRETPLADVASRNQL